MNILGVIPARMASSRFPGKPLVKIYGMPMISHVYYRAKMCQNLSEICVATCDKEIVDYINSIDGKAIMTKDVHERATDRTGEAFEIIMDTNGGKYDGVLMMQGDEPLLNPVVLDNMISFHVKQKSPYITNLISAINDIDEFNNPNVVKVVKDKSDNILYMSRSPIPSNAKFNGKFPMWKQLGHILFSKEAIKTFTQLEPTELETIESVDMNRILENDLKITAYPTLEVSQAVDVPDDIPVVERLIKEDKYLYNYI